MLSTMNCNRMAKRQRMQSNQLPAAVTISSDRTHSPEYWGQQEVPAVDSCKHRSAEEPSVNLWRLEPLNNRFDLYLCPIQSVLDYWPCD
jgi:hypothetical protein